MKVLILISTFLFMVIAEDLAEKKIQTKGKITYIGEGLLNGEVIEEETAKRSDEEKFIKMCQNVVPFTGKQMAVAWIGEDDYSEAQKKNPFDTNVPDGLLRKGDYYMAARIAGFAETIGDSTVKYDNAGRHTESIITEKFGSVIDKYISDKSVATPKMYLFTFNSPCSSSFEDKEGGCAGKVSKWGKENNKISKLVIGWDQLFIPPRSKVPTADELAYEIKFLNSLNHILKNYPKVDFDYKNKVSYCAQNERKAWFQFTLFNCVKAKMGEKKFGCSSSEDAKKDLIRFINSVSFFCASRKDVIPEKRPKGRSVLKEPECWKTNFEKFITKEDKAEFQLHIATCIDDNLRATEVGPALKKNALNGEVSKDTDDFRNPDAEAKFCFTA